MENQIIQKNAFDVALELLKTHINMEDTKADDIDKIFAKYYSLARILEIKGKNTSESKYLLNFIPNDIKEKL